MRIHYYKKNQDSEPEITTIREAKKLLKKKGGLAYTEHYERDGTMFEVTEITLGNNQGTNYTVSYNHHL